MAIVYNPPAPQGSPIPPFNFEGNEYKDQNNEKVLLAVGGLLQFSDAVAQDMVKRWPFLEIVTPERAKQLLELVKCEFCEVTFKPEAKSAMEAHLKIHEPKEVLEEIVPDIPQAETVVATPNRTMSERTQDDLTSGPEFYGPGLTQTKGI